MADSGQDLALQTSSGSTYARGLPLDSGGRLRRDGLGMAFDARALLEGPRIRRRSSEAGFWAKVDKAGPVVVVELGACWLWTGHRHADGYGRVTWCGIYVQAHRVAYSLTHGAMEHGSVARHRCDNRPCCNPAHLEIGTIQDNNADMRGRRRARSWMLERPATGTANVNAKLTEERVRELRAAWEAGETIKSIVERTGLAVGTIHPMLHRRTWRHVA